MISQYAEVTVPAFNVEGPKVANHDGNTTQDFVCINANTFGAPDAKASLQQIKMFDKNLDTPKNVKHAVSVAARATNAVLKAVHLPSATLEGVGAPAYVAKIGFAPSSKNLTVRTGKSVDLGADYNTHEDLIQRFFREETAVWDVNAQLALAPANPQVKEKEKDFPIKVADKPWPEDKSP
jgi:hypothetical protein